MVQVKRPANHVTRGLTHGVNFRGEAMPDLSERQVAWLKQNFPAKCWDHRRETQAEHLEYGGMVKLAETLIAMYESNADTDEGLDPTMIDADAAN